MYEKEIKICDDVFESRSDGIEMRAWQTLKTAVLAQQSTNTAMVPCKCGKEATIHMCPSCFDETLERLTGHAQHQ